MAIAVVTPDNLEYFKGKQDDFNAGEYAKKSDVPTKVSQLTNDSGYQTESQLQAAINAAIASVLVWKGVKATTGELPQSGNKTGDVWHVSEDSAEYAWNGSTWEALGGMLQASVAWTDITGKPSTFTPATHSHDAATTSAAGFMSTSDKAKLDGIAEGANAYTHPSSAAGAKSSGLYKVATDAQGHVTGATPVSKADITGLGIPGQDTTYGLATQSAAGLMSASDKTKLDNLEEAVAMTTEEIDALFEQA